MQSTDQASSGISSGRILPKIAACWPHTGPRVSDPQRMRPQRPWDFTNLKTGQGLQALIDFIVERGMLQAGKGQPDL